MTTPLDRVQRLREETAAAAFDDERGHWWLETTTYTSGVVHEGWRPPSGESGWTYRWVDGTDERGNE